MPDREGLYRPNTAAFVWKLSTPNLGRIPEKQQTSSRHVRHTKAYSRLIFSLPGRYVKGAPQGIS